MCEFGSLECFAAKNIALKWKVQLENQKPPFNEAVNAPKERVMG